jgi:hypothetical protein
MRDLTGTYWKEKQLGSMVYFKITRPKSIKTKDLFQAGVWVIQYSNGVMDWDYGSTITHTAQEITEAEYKLATIK